MGLPAERSKPPEAFAEPLLPEGNTYAREAGYSLHLLQVRELVTDARRLSLDPGAAVSEHRRCAP